MPIWDRLTQDPMSAMILMSSLQQLPQSMSKQNLPPRGAYAPQGYGQQDGGMGDMVPQMLRMQQMQAQQANMQADNDLQRKQFEYDQQTAAQQAAAEQQRMEAIERAIPSISDQTGQPQEVVRAALRGLDKDNPLLKALSSRFESYTLGGGQGRYGPDGKVQAAMPEKTEFGSYLLGEHSIDQKVVNAKGQVARLGATNVINNLDARNMGNAEAGMQEALIKEREGLVGDIGTLRGEVESLSRGTDMALQHPDWTGPLAEEKAALLRAKAAAMAPFGGSLSPDETEFISFVDEFTEGKFAQTLKKVEKLTPVTENEFAKAEKTAVGADSPVPRIVTKGLRAKKQYDYAMEKKRFIDQATDQLVREARSGGAPYSPGRLQMLVEDWEKQNPFPMDSYVKELSALSQAYPMGGGKKGAPKAAADSPPDDADADALAEFYRNKK